MSGSGDHPFRYDAALAGEIEARWQRRWSRDGTFWSPNPAGPLAAGFGKVAGRPPLYVLDMFAYPSGIGLHVGHPLGYLATDAFARYQRMCGRHVLHAYGYDAFGLPAEQFAIDTGQHPRVTTEANISVMAAQLRRLGLGHDSRRTFATCDPAYYRWTQWIFGRIFGSWCDERSGRARPVADLVAEFESGGRQTPDGRPWAELTAAERRGVVDGRRLAYLSDEPVNWCPALGTVLANEEVTAQGRSDVGNHPVYRRRMRQWMLRITAFAGRLADDLDLVDWPESVKRMQRHWIGAPGQPRMRDWLFSRQRYWGEPFPIVYDAAGLPVLLPDEMLPVELPDMADFRPAPAQPESEPVPPLGRAPGWSAVELDLGDGPQVYRRELNTMPQWAGSCWYYLRYTDPANDQALADPVNESYWMARQATASGGGVDLYVGGAEHAVLHLLYARFWHKVLYDLGYVSTREPFARLVNQGYVLADAFTDDRGRYVPAADVVTATDGSPSYHGRPVTRRAGKMGKSLKNGVSPDEICQRYGADTLRVYELGMGPIDADRPWRPQDIAGAHRLLQRLWRAVVSERTGLAAVSDAEADEATTRLLHATIAAVRADYGELKYNTAIARLTELTATAGRVAARDGALPRSVAEPLVLMIAPLAPHIAEDLWRRLGHQATLAYEDFPRADPRLAAASSQTLPVQVNGKTRFVLTVRPGAGRDELERALRDAPEFAALTGGRQPDRLVIVPGRVINLVLD
ncbi:MAG TPA: class I tRNA ligase family protein [Streptosporangiaceae bacterium]|nr:class I tRNA ligase family protein [Streptosporangiaceae bacterium]